MAKSSNRKQGLIEAALKKLKMKNVSHGEDRGARKSLNEAKQFRFDDLLPKEIVERLNELRKERTNEPGE